MDRHRDRQRDASAHGAVRLPGGPESGLRRRQDRLATGFCESRTEPCQSGLAEPSRRAASRVTFSETALGHCPASIGAIELINTAPKEIHMQNSRVLLIVAMVAAAAASRIIPHPPNVAPITA